MKHTISFTVLAFVLCTFTSCLTAKKLDAFVAAQYNNELPKPKNKKAQINVAAAPTSDNATISSTVHKTDKFLPLVIYWKYDHRHSCSLNQAIAATNFTNAVNTGVSKAITDKLNGRKLALTLEQAPANFSIVCKENLVWLVYAFSWSKVFIEPETKDLVVSYKVTEADQTVKAGTITVKNTDRNKGIRAFQSWKSATSEYLGEYNSNFTTMTKSFVTQLTAEL